MTKMLTKNIYLLSAALTFSALVGLVPANAAVSPDQPAANTGYMDEVLGTASQYWGAASDTVLSWIPGLPSASALTRRLEGPEDKSVTDFKNMMSIAGYAVKSINTGVGIVPKFSLYFGQKREMSEADVDYVNRLLRKHMRTKSGPVAASQRLIIQTVLLFQQFPDYDLAKVTVTMLPLPSVEFVAEPKDTVLDAELSYIAQRIKDLNTKLDEMN